MAINTSLVDATIEPAGRYTADRGSAHPVRACNGSKCITSTDTISYRGHHCVRKLSGSTCPSRNCKCIGHTPAATQSRAQRVCVNPLTSRPFSKVLGLTIELDHAIAPHISGLFGLCSPPAVRWPTICGTLITFAARVVTVAINPINLVLWGRLATKNSKEHIERFESSAYTNSTTAIKSVVFVRRVLASQLQRLPRIPLRRSCSTVCAGSVATDFPGKTSARLCVTVSQIPHYKFSLSTWGAFARAYKDRRAVPTNKPNERQPTEFCADRKCGRIKTHSESPLNLRMSRPRLLQQREGTYFTWSDEL